MDKNFIVFVHYNNRLYISWFII